jgi:hypothetical protein
VQTSVVVLAVRQVAVGDSEGFDKHRGLKILYLLFVKNWGCKETTIVKLWAMRYLQITING